MCKDLCMMPSLKQKRKAYRKKYYNEHGANVQNPTKAEYNRSYYARNAEKLKRAAKTLYKLGGDRKKASSRAAYRADPEKKKAASRAQYQAEPEKKRAACRAQYQAEPEKKRAACRAQYQAEPEKKRAACRAQYRAKPEKKRATSKAHYHAQSHRKKALFRAYFARKRCARIMSFRKYYACHRDDIRIARRGRYILSQQKPRYILSQPKPCEKEMYLKELQTHLSHDFEAKSELTKAFKKLHESVAKRMPRVLQKTVCRLAARRLLNKVLQIRKEHAGLLLKSIRSIKSLQITQREDFGIGCHTMASEPYFYDSSYQHMRRDIPIPVNEDGQCVVAKELHTDNEKEGACAQRKKWECCSECKPITDTEVDAILTLKAAFEKPLQEVRHALDECDSGCPNGHYCKVHVIEFSSVGLKGHPLVCSSSSGGCQSQLRVLRAAATHFPVLRQFLHDVHSAIRSHMCVFEIDKALCSGNFQRLMQITDVDKLDALLNNDLNSSYEQSTDTECKDSALRQPNLETQLFITHAGLIAELEKEIDDFPEYICCSCERLHQRKSVTVVKLNDNLSNDVWPRLKSFILKQTPDAGDHILYMCKYCKPMLKRDRLPPRCVLNGLETVPIPPELAALDSLSRQLIQRAKCYQTIVRLGTYTAKVPIYNSLKACKGTVFFLPLPLNKTLETLDQVEQCGGALPNPELYIIVNGRPTKSKVVWRSLVDVNRVKKAISTLKLCNWLYRDVRSESIDETTKHIIEVSNTAPTSMLVKATKDDVASFQAYTIRNLDNKLSPTSDIEQYKLLSVREGPIDNRQQYLDVMCFPVLFPTGKFGEFHPRQEKLSHSEYIKSRLLNKDSRFRKDAQYVFYLLWQKEMRELSAGVYNLLKSTRRQAMSVSKLLDSIEGSDEHLEANLCTMLQSVRGTKQYWFIRNSELKCMIREWGSPTFFLTFSCAEYDSPDITEYLRRVNNVSSHYSIGKLCTEDPISVSRKFSLKFHAFFRKVLLNGEVLGKVDHFYWKKEYQARGAPHYHVLLWIRDAPVIGQDDPDKVLTWIQDRITCHIPDNNSSPELYQLVTRYQLHKCSAYCKRRRKCGKNTFITRCRFGFPHPVCDSAKLNPVQESLKSKSKIYQLIRTDSEARVNDYNPLLLLLWKANIDIQFVAESSLALAHYVSGYVTKAEKSSMQEIWQEVGENKSIYSRLWSFGIRSLRFRECGLYEASDLLLGDHLSEKSDTIKWLDISMPHKRSRRLKDHKQLKEIAEHNPDNEDIFEDNLVDNFYPQRPQELEDVCLYDFVANYDWQGKDRQGRRTYKKLTKPKLPNHKLFDPENENQRENYYYSLVLLFSPFRDESSLLLENETAEAAFHRLMSNKSSSYHAKLETILVAQSNVRQINDARQAEGQEEKVSKEDDDPQLIGEAKMAMNDVLDINASSFSELSLDDRVAMLNGDQRRIFDNVKAHLLHQQCHEANECSCDLKPLRMFISGVGGTGKSFLIETIRALVASIWSLDGLMCAIAAPTGLAAFNVGGITIHRLFQLPIDHSGKAATYWSLPKTSQKVMKTTLRNVKLFIIDEISMVSSLNLAYMHMRLEELFGGDEWFGSRNMLFVGDLLQLQPVSGSPVFERIATKSLLFQLGCATAVNIWKDSVVYDELTINERQKKDKEFSSLLDCVRRGCPTDETLCTLKKRVVEVSISDKFSELQKSGQTPVCLFPTRKACDDFNYEMLRQLTSEVHELLCTDEVDQTVTSRKWTKKAAEQLEKLNNDCNMTAGLEAKLSLSVGARVMLRRNIDTKAGLVNGALGTVLSITFEHVTVQFDHMNDPYKVEMVKSRFMVMKNFYVYRKQFPLILAYAVTIHKCQGLSLDCAIVDLSDEVFSAGMAYVALSRVRSLSGLYLSAFSPKSLLVSTTCLKEVNRLRQTFRQDLPLYDIPSRASKRALTATTEHNCPRPKRIKQDPHASSTTKRKRENSVEGVKPAKQMHCGRDSEPGVSPLKFHPVSEQWQRNVCARMGLQFHGKNRVRPGGPNVSLTPPDMRTVKHIMADGNCLFRSLAYIITGSEDQHMAIRTAILEHMIDIAHLILDHHIRGYSSIQEYIRHNSMDNEFAWGTDIEMLTLAHLLQTPVVSYSVQYSTWQRYAPHDLDRILSDDVQQMSMYLVHIYNHFEVVCSVRKSG